VSPYDEYWFTGTVGGVSRWCLNDGICSITVEVESSRGHTPVEPGVVVTVIENAVFTTTPCPFGEANLEIQAGQEVEVRAGPTQGDELSICANERFFVKSPD
jgi:hypothetical protein